jgi:RNA polymerase sigma-70 factor (ECF subfamily)
MLKRLKDPSDRTTWEEFHRTYRGLIQGVARRAGLNETEADEVVQETLIEVARKMPGFRYDPARDSFKGWLLQITGWRIADQFRKRQPPLPGHRPSTSGPGPMPGKEPAMPARTIQPAADDEPTATSTVGRLPDPAGPALAVIWDEEWAKHLLDTALARIKRQASPAQYEIYHLHVILGKPATEVRRALGVNVGQIYLAKHRVGSLLKRELRKLETELL